MAKSGRPRTPEELVERLSELMPSFAHEWAEEAADEEPWELTFHRVIRSLTYVLGVMRESLSQTQIERLGIFINDCVAVDDDLENAISTCCLEHLHQINALKTLWPYCRRERDANAMPNPALNADAHRRAFSPPAVAG